VEDSITAIRNRLIIINRTGKDVSLDAAAMMRGVMTRIIKIFRNMVTHSFLDHEYNSIWSAQKHRAPGDDSRGFEGRTSALPNDYRIKGERVDRPVKSSTAAERNTTTTFAVDCPRRANMVALAMRYRRILLYNGYFISAPFCFSLLSL
jgi:hypothetical protein